MAYTDPKDDWVPGDVLTSAQVDVLADDIQFLASPPMCRVTKSSGTNVADTTSVALTFDTEQYDSDSMHSTVSNTGRITFNTAGVYAIGAQASFETNATGYRRIYIRSNGATTVAQGPDVAAHAGDITPVAVEGRFKAAAGDYIEVLVYQNSGSTLVVESHSSYSPVFYADFKGLGT